MDIEKTDSIEKKKSQSPKKADESKSEEHAIQSEEPVAPHGDDPKKPEPEPVGSDDKHDANANKDDNEAN
jgi:hypothetical protein